MKKFIILIHFILYFIVGCGLGTTPRYMFLFIYTDNKPMNNFQLSYEFETKKKELFGTKYRLETFEKEYTPSDFYNNNFNRNYHRKYESSEKIENEIVEKYLDSSKTRYITRVEINVTGVVNRAVKVTVKSDTTFENIVFVYEHEIRTFENTNIYIDENIVFD